MLAVSKQTRKGKEKKWDSKAGKVTIGQVVAYSLDSKVGVRNFKKTPKKHDIVLNDSPVESEIMKLIT